MVGGGARVQVFERSRSAPKTVSLFRSFGDSCSTLSTSSLRWLERARGAFVQQDAGQGARDKLSKKQYDDEVSWTTRTWSSLMAQRMSVALHMAAAWEIARELSLAGAEDEAALFGGGVADSVA